MFIHVQLGQPLVEVPQRGDSDDGSIRHGQTITHRPGPTGTPYQHRRLPSGGTEREVRKTNRPACAAGSFSEPDNPNIARTPTGGVPPSCHLAEARQRTPNRATASHDAIWRLLQTQSRA